MIYFIIAFLLRFIENSTFFMDEKGKVEKLGDGCVV